MKILWFLNNPIGLSAKYLGYTNSQSGTWIDTKLKDLQYNITNNDCIGIALFNTPYNKLVIDNNFLIYGVGEKAYIGKKSNSYKNTEKIIKEFSPDIIQIWGSEYSFGLNIIKIAKNLHIPVVFYIQGVMQAISEFTYGGISFFDLFFHSGLLSIPKTIKFYLGKNYYKKQKKIESELIINSAGYICDNNWVKSYLNKFNNNCFFDINKVNEIFSNNKWNFDNINKNTIMTVAGTKPEKGLHKLLKSLIYVKFYYPDIKLIIPGNMNFGLRENPFVSYLKWFIKKNNLINNVEFLGQLNSDEMCKNLMHSHIFINPSYIENISTSLREAMYIGMPCISSMAGSVYEFISHNYNGILYRYEETEVLSHEILNILDNRDKAQYLGNNAYTSIREKYPQSKNDITLLKIYKDLIDKNK